LRKQFLIPLFAIFAVLWVSCKTEKNRTQELEPAIVGGKMIFRIASFSHLVHHFILPYDSKFLPSTASVFLFDSSNTDGNGFVYRIDFGKGIYCKDGYKRKGSFTIEVSDTFHGYAVNGNWQSIASDSFAVLTSAGWEFTYGYFSLLGINSDSALLKCNLIIAQKDKTYTLRNTNATYLAYYTDGNFNAYKTGFHIQGGFDFSTLGKFFSIQDIQVDKKPDCLSHWSSGTLNVKNETGETWKVNMDPFGNARCDMVFKASHKTKGNLLEDVIDAW